ncbi:MAG: aspartate--tRNA ligase, partial [Gemmatimonadota bacterium]
MSSPATALRTHRAGSLTRADVGQTVRLGGWVHRRRDLGGLIFIDLRDREGLVQLSLSPDWTPAPAMERAGGLGIETVILATGRVVLRPNPARDEEMTSREVEVYVTDLVVVGPAVTPPIPVARKEGEELPAEELRLKNRVIDLRRPALVKNMILRHNLAQRARRTLSELGFLEIETPILTKPTPEGARDYLVPSRVQRGEFYALPQSPQIYKQLLMVAGYDRYFQIARCFRDEDLRADRQPEFTQIDIEASFVSQDDVMGYIEAVLGALWDEAGEPIGGVFQRLTYRDATERYGIDKPDLRFPLEITDFTTRVSDDSAAFVHEAVAKGGRLRGILVPGGASLSRKDLDGLAEQAKSSGVGGLIWARFGTAWEGPGVKVVRENFLRELGAPTGTLLVAVVGADSVTSPALHAVRTALIRRLGLVPSVKHAFAWVVDFPLFEPDPATGQHI